MKLDQLFSLRNIPAPWETGDKIPWNEPEFSQRMLVSHLSQDHDWASRRKETIDRQVRWIDAQLPRQARILDLGCGPGLYTQRLAALGHACVGVDFSPASIAYAQKQADKHGLSIAYHLADLRTWPMTGSFDLVMMTFGELNVFRRQEIEIVIQNALRSLNEGGMLLTEVHIFDAVKQAALLPPSWEYKESGLFSTRPHLLLQEQFWNEAHAAAIARYLVVDTQTSRLTQYGATMQAYTDEEYLHLFGAESGTSVELLEEDDWSVGETFKGKLQTFVTRMK